ncbi:MAG: anti-sigma-factor antagonist [Solirubrobacterales bacterium]|jgi:anti-anti-sigma factor|nr:anti-sigma-factor antagonist [Solirubrobacterales bacterium]
MVVPSRALGVSDAFVDGRRTIKLSGELDLATVRGLADAVAAPAEEAEQTVLDLSDLTFLDLSGLRAICDASRYVARLRIVGPDAPQVRRLFELTGLIDQLPFGSDPFAAAT